MTLDLTAFQYAASWYGALALVSLLTFASLAYEIQLAQADCHRSGSQQAWVVVQRTLHVNFLAYALLHVPVAFACVKLYGTNGADARPWFSLGILCTGAYYSYTRACERSLLEFLTRVGIAMPRTPANARPRTRAKQ